jgi:hypothetical protein
MMGILGLSLAQTSAWAVEVELTGSTGSGCAEANGTYGYEKRDFPIGSYDVWGEITTSKTCSYGLRLQTRYKYWNSSAGGWYDTGWETIASGVTTVEIDQAGLPVKDVKFRIADYINGRLRNYGDVS